MGTINKNLRVIIFDFGKVLFPIEPWEGQNSSKEERAQIRAAVAEIAKMFGKELTSGNFSATDFAREFRKRTSGIKEQILARVVDSICVIDKKLLTLISELTPEFKIYGLVNAPFGWTEIRRGIHQLDRYFIRVFVSYEVEARKPDSEIFRYLLKNIEVAPAECLLVDDKPENILAGEALEIQGYVFDSFEGLKGYLKSVR